MNLVSDILGRREMLGSLVSRDLKSRYKGSLLGFFWSILTPLFMALIYVVFLRLLARNVPIEEIIIGVFAWQFTVSSVNSGLVCVTGNANLVKKVAFPRLVLPLSSTLANLVNFLLSLVVQFVLVIIILASRGGSISGWTLLLPAMILYQTMFNLALALLVGAANVYFRDTQHLVGLFLSAWFFVSPVMYTLTLLHDLAADLGHLLSLYMLNPMAVIVTAYRAMILPDAVFTWTPYVWAGLLWPLALLVAACAVYQRAQKNFADML